MTIVYGCRGCGAPITFDNNIKSNNGKVIPLNTKDKSVHDCPAKRTQNPSTSTTSTETLSITQFEHALIGLAKETISGINSRLKSFQLEISIKDTRS